jgi:hypothetical protein
MTERPCDACSNLVENLPDPVATAMTMLGAHDFRLYDACVQELCRHCDFSRESLAALPHPV